ncbi:hypothetical protein F7725_015132 [Dissostichus mawsoni]|uniref:PLAT domain-containing protein n=1 Tax=Dissostichus mawsoni TaxID=36200 RepID=A0A7J5YGR4_DISMA|nr:hypothetical protein F7725_015132 [Dissostichus mawsoni]
MSLSTNQRQAVPLYYSNSTRLSNRNALISAAPELDSQKTRVKYIFACKCWLAKDRGDGLTSRVFNILYEVTVVTGDVQNAGTDTLIFMSVFGANGTTEEMLLKKNEDRTHGPKRTMICEMAAVVDEEMMTRDVGSEGMQQVQQVREKQVDTFRFSEILSMGELSKVRDEIMDKTFRFPCDRWLAKNDDDGQIMGSWRALTTTTWTSTRRPSTKSASRLEKLKPKKTPGCSRGEKGPIKRICNGETPPRRSEPGDIAGICLGHTPKDGKKVKGDVFWQVEERDDFLTFECTKTIESFASKARSLVPVKYEIIVITGDEKGAGTDANVFITIYGVNGDSGRRQLRQKFRNLFEREQTDRFLLEMLDMGELQKVRMDQDNSGLSPGWLLDRVEVTNTANGVTTIFLCGKWLDLERADKQIARASQLTTPCVNYENFITDDSTTGGSVAVNIEQRITPPLKDGHTLQRDVLLYRECPLPHCRVSDPGLAQRSVSQKGLETFGKAPNRGGGGEGGRGRVEESRNHTRVIDKERRMGHFLLVANHWSTQPWWKRCMQGNLLEDKERERENTKVSDLTSSLSSSMDRQMVHFSSTSVSSSSPVFRC